MSAYINERSLEDHADWSAALQALLLIVQELADAGESVFRDGRYFLTPRFKQRFNALAFPKDQRALVQSLVFSNRYCPCWTPHRQSDPNVAYSCADPATSLLDESLCEATAAETTRADPLLCNTAISSRESVFGEKQRLNLSSSAPDSISVELRNAATLAMAREYLAQRRGYYDWASRTAPKDFQTILEKDVVRFARTARVERRGRRIFQEVQTGRFYYVDDAHFGPVAHMEVFSADGEHLGVANINTGIVDESRRVEGRRLRH